MSIHECGNEDLLDLLLVVSQEFPNLDVVDSTAQIGVHEEAASLMLRFVFADHRSEDLCESSPDRLLSGRKASAKTHLFRRDSGSIGNRIPNSSFSVTNGPFHWMAMISPAIQRSWSGPALPMTRRKVGI